MNAKPLVSIVILNLNGRKYLKDCLESIKKNTMYPNYEIIVVDNNSCKKDIGFIKACMSKKIIDRAIFNSKNRGFSSANNQAFEICHGKYYFMLNNDTIVQKGWLESSVKLAESEEKIAAVGSTLIEQGRGGGRKKIPKKEKATEVFTACGAAMLMKKSVVDKIGLLDAENFSPAYAEETDWCYRARNSGYKIMETSESRVIHLTSVSARKLLGKKGQYLLLHTHKIKAMLFNLSAADLLKQFPELALDFLSGIRTGMAKTLLKSYWNNIKNYKTILNERKKRKPKKMLQDNFATIENKGKKKTKKKRNEKKKTQKDCGIIVQPLK